MRSTGMRSTGLTGEGVIAGLLSDTLVCHGLCHGPMRPLTNIATYARRERRSEQHRRTDKAGEHRQAADGEHKETAEDTQHGQHHESDPAGGAQARCEKAKEPEQAGDDQLETARDRPHDRHG